MTPERRKRAEEVFRAALDLPAEERAEFITVSCRGDEDLRTQVESLVTQHGETDSLIESPALRVKPLHPSPDDLRTALAEDLDDPMVGRRVGAYRLVREIGRGGMGAVYLAVRADSEFRRRVAVKLIKRGMDTDFVVRRFRHERQILAALDHPNIALLLDGGSTEDGLPYFVMEYIEGEQLFRYCDTRRLGVRERLRLFLRVCSAVAYAHQNLVIHRDLKPSNVLVTADGTPKLLDFGIAKLLNPEMAADTLIPTATAMRLMTPEYASPEQVQGVTMTAASDVYSLGVLLYELLTGHRPYRIHSRMTHEVARVVCEAEPERPSEAITRPGGALPFSYGGNETPTLELLWEARGAAPDSLRRELAGNLDNVVMKALHKDPQGRYKTAEQLRDDITRHLEGRPVAAPPYAPPAARISRPTTGEPVTGEKTLAVLPLKVLCLDRREDTGNDYLSVGLADALITRLSGLRRFTVRPTGSILRYAEEGSDPFDAGRELGVGFVLAGRVTCVGERIRVTVQLLDVSARSAVWAGQFDEKLTDVLSLEDSLSARVAEALVPHLTGGERLRLAKRPTDSPEAFEAYLRGRYHWSTSSPEGFARAIECYRRAVELDPNFALAYTGIADYFNWLGVFCLMPFRESSAAAKEAAARAVELDDSLAEAYSALGFAVLCRDFDWAASLSHYRRALELNPNYALTHVWYSYRLLQEGHLEAGVAEARKGLELDPHSPLNHLSLAWAYYQARRYDEAVAELHRLITDEPQYGMGYFVLCWLLRKVGEHEEAVRAGRRAVELLGRSPFSLSALGAAYAAAGMDEQTREVLREVEALSAQTYSPPYLLSLLHCNRGDKEQAFALLERARTIGDAWIAWLGAEPQFDLLRDDPRFGELLRLTGNPWSGRPAGAAAAATEGHVGQHPSAIHTTGAGQSARLTRAAERPATDDGEAHQLYVAGRYYATKRTADGLRLAIERLEQAVGKDPRFALAYAELADCYSLLNWYVEPPPPDAFARAKQAALKAVEADPDLAEARASLGFVKFHYDRDWSGAGAEFRRAIELKPDSAPARRWYAFSLSAAGRHEEGVAEMRRAQEISPRSAVIATAVANVLFLARRFGEAVEQCRRALELDPGSVAAHVILRWTYEHMGRHKEALAVYEQERVFAGDTPTTKAKRAHVLAACGRKAEALEVLEELLGRRDKEWVTAYEIAVIYALLGDRDAAFEWLTVADREHAVGLTYALVDPHLDNLRADPRYQRVMRGMGLIN